MPNRTDLLYEVVIWPHRSLTPEIYRNVFIVILAGFGFVLGAIAFSPWAEGHRALYMTGVGVIGSFCLGATLLTRYAVLRHAREANDVRERVAIEGESLTIERTDRRGRRAWDFSPHWAQVRMRDTRRVKQELLVMQSGRAVSVGLFLTPEERSDLAEELRTALADFAAGRLPRGA